MQGGSGVIEKLGGWRGISPNFGNFRIQKIVNGVNKWVRAAKKWKTFINFRRQKVDLSFNWKSRLERGKFTDVNFGTKNPIW